MPPAHLPRAHRSAASRLAVVVLDSVRDLLDETGRTRRVLVRRLRRGGGGVGAISSARAKEKVEQSPMIRSASVTVAAARCHTESVALAVAPHPLTHTLDKMVCDREW